MALLSKTATCTLPAVILLIIWWKKDSIKLKDVLWVTPFLLLTLIMARITFVVEKSFAGAQGTSWEFSFWERFIIAGKTLWFYLYKLVFPLNLTLYLPQMAGRIFNSNPVFDSLGLCCHDYRLVVIAKYCWESSTGCHSIFRRNLVSRTGFF